MAVTRGEELAEVHARTEASATEALARLARAIPVADRPPGASLPLVAGRLTE
jgi:hypothetical protein